ncbi:MAG: hypothetical protein Q4D80_02655, partial [Pseudomonadota bacterium]|nr:hypothetical protein [Pseudomonadota bacterium]
KFKTNKTISEYNYLIQGVLENIDYFNHLNAAGSQYSLGEIISALGLVPETWKKVSGMDLRDTRGYQVGFYTRNSHFSIEIILGKDNRKSDTEFCEAMMRDVACPLSNVFYRVWFFRYGKGNSYYYGDKYCRTEDMQCLRNMNLSDINTLCKSCISADSVRYCSLILNF